MGKEYVPIFFDWLETTQDLSSEEKGNLIDAVVSYASGKEYDHLLTGGCKIAFRFLKGQVDRNTAISEARSRAGSSKAEQNVSNANKTDQTASKPPIKSKNNKDSKKQEQLFDQFWAAYPKHQSKAQALKAFLKMNPDDELLAKMLKAIDTQRNTAQWLENGGQYIPYPATWLNGKRWEDEPENAVKQAKKVSPAQDFSQRDYSDVNNELLNELAEDMKAFKKEGA